MPRSPVTPNIKPVSLNTTKPMHLQSDTTKKLAEKPLKSLVP